MRTCVFEDRGVAGLDPLACTRPAFDLWCGASPLLTKQARHFAATELGALVRPALAAVTREDHPALAVNDCTWLRAGPTVLVNARWLPPALPADPDPTPRVGLVGDQVAYAVLPASRVTYCSPNTLDDCLATWTQTLPRVPAGGALINFPWDLVERQPLALRQEAEQWRAAHGRPFRPANLTVVGPSDQVYVAPSARVDPHVVADTTHGPVVIAEEAIVYPFSRLEGPCFVGPQSQILGAKLRGAAVGPVCRVGGEVEASILHGHCNKYHDGFLGHSYVGAWVNVAAGVQVSDLRHDYRPVRMTVGGQRVDTGLAKVGAFIGDHAKLGLNVLLNTGTMVGPFANLLPTGTYLPRLIPAFARMEDGHLLEQTDVGALINVASEMMRRRGRELSPAYAALVRTLHEQTAAGREQVLRYERQRQLRRSA
jgi:UDP-N-acetylglucosamine diphosphorylase/glucosamine-1-phosphate N-acetyltransferase